MRRILGIIAIIVGVSLAVSWYIHRARMRALNSGDVFVREMPGETPKPPPSSPSSPSTPAPTPASTPATGPAAPGAPPQPQLANLTVPAADSIPRNPPNGAIYAGTGKYQLYRQGDLTWRLNTDTGWACVIFATDAQWSRSRVWREGCRTSGDSSPATGN